MFLQDRTMEIVTKHVNDIEVYKKIAEELDKLYKPRAVLTWHADDILSRPDGEKLTEEEVSDILEEIMRRHDCDLGVSWTTLDCHIQSKLEGRG